MGSQVEIVRDVDGIAHVRAADLHGALFGQGYAAAQDRLWQMHFDRMRAAGRAAELVGPNGVPADRFHRRLGLARAARRDVAELQAETQDALAAYAAGVTAWIARVQADPDAHLPEELRLLGVDAGELEPWEPWHSVALFKVRHLLMGTFDVKLWRSGLVGLLGPETAAKLWPSEPGPTTVPSPDLVARTAAILPELQVVAAAVATIPGHVGDGAGGAGSNNLAIHGSRTASGSPLLAGDPHRALDLPNTYWQNHLTCPEADAIGLSFPGVPGFPHFGHNADAAWCITHGMADDQDVYVERLRRSAGDAVEAEQAGGRWATVDAREETIAVRGEEAVTVTVAETANGPVVAGDAELGVGLALRWTSLAEPDRTFDALVPMLRARSGTELDDAMRCWVTPVNNVLMADRAGSIAYRLRGRLAQRPAANGWGVVPGWSGDHGWTGWVDYDDQPHVVDPPQGWLMTANHRPAAGGPYVTNDFAHPARSLRLTELLSSRPAGWDVDTVVDVLGDTQSLVAPRFVKRLLAVPTDDGSPARGAQDVLRGWDGRMDTGSAGAAVYATARVELLAVVVSALGLHDSGLAPLHTGPAAATARRFAWTRLGYLVEQADDELLAAAGGWSEAFAWALQATVDRLGAELGGEPATWRWGDVHHVRWTHPLAALRPDLASALSLPPAPSVGGDGDCLCATALVPPDLGAARGPVARYVFDLGDWDRSRWIVPHGVSAVPGPHHTDQVDDWASLRLRPMRYSRAAVDQATAHSESLQPPVDS